MGSTTVRIPNKEVEDLMVTLWGSKSAGVYAALNAYVALRRRTLPTLQGLFTRNEWMFMIDSFWSNLYNPSIASSKQAFLMEVQDSAKLDGTDLKWNISLESVQSKLNDLEVSQIFFLRELIHQYIDSDDGKTEKEIYDTRRKAIIEQYAKK